MDEVRKDFAIMIIHHVLTIVLLCFSYAVGYHKIGLCVLFVHDVTDIVLEYTKCHVYMQNRNGKFYLIHQNISNIGFIVFTITW